MHLPISDIFTKSAANSSFLLLPITYRNITISILTKQTMQQKIVSRLKFSENGNTQTCEEFTVHGGIVISQKRLIHN